MTAIYLGTEKSAAGETGLYQTKVVRPRNNRYPTFNVTALPAMPSSSRAIFRLSGLGLILLCIWLIVG